MVKINSNSKDLQNGLEIKDLHLHNGQERIENNSEDVRNGIEINGDLHNEEETIVDLQVTYENILNEIYEHVLEGLSFEIHRAVKLGYFSKDEYEVRDNVFQIYKSDENDDGSDDVVRHNGKLIDIFGHEYGETTYAICPYCNKSKGSKVLAAHIRKCYEKYSSEQYETNSTTSNDSKSSTSNYKTYDKMTPDEIQLILENHCGVVSQRTGKMCANSRNCRKHEPDQKKAIRKYFSGKSSDNDLLDKDTTEESSPLHNLFSENSDLLEPEF